MSSSPLRANAFPESIKGIAAGFNGAETRKAVDRRSSRGCLFVKANVVEKRNEYNDNSMEVVAS